MGQAHEPPAVGIVGGELGRHPELAQGGKVERPPGSPACSRLITWCLEFPSML